MADRTAAAPTLDQRLRDLGYTHRPATAVNHRDILDTSGAVVATLTAAQAWEWLEARHG